MRQVDVRNGNVEQAMRVFKRKIQSDGTFREVRQRRFYEKPSAMRARKRSDMIRRQRKIMRKRFEREGF